MKPEALKTTGYLISTVSVGLLGAAAWPGAEKAGLTSVLLLGMASSVAGMACRWWSYETERREKRSSRPRPAAPPSRAPGLGLQSRHETGPPQ